ncbi:hypothetical protein BRCON_0230 [Candidatus Sumerlaea chitinivorans]|uniref:Uncharacterized protein n=1 Tax=Sumerlaea chitinivorans TaxID=2250252 RepID=A0A2Z4Y1D9_SUMC1|nr:hypothetical protein BRCON_0230 [Candidatus Sumerlaea chitinivorans]
MLQILQRKCVRGSKKNVADFCHVTLRSLAQRAYLFSESCAELPKPTA